MPACVVLDDSSSGESVPPLLPARSRPAPPTTAPLTPGDHTVHTRTRLTALCPLGGLVAEWLACWTQSQKGPGSNRSRDAVG